MPSAVPTSDSVDGATSTSGSFGNRWRGFHDYEIDRQADETTIRISTNHHAFDLFVLPAIILVVPSLVVAYAFRFHEPLFIGYIAVLSALIALAVFIWQPSQNYELTLSPMLFIYAGSDFRRHWMKTWIASDITKLRLAIEGSGKNRYLALTMTLGSERRVRLLPGVHRELCRFVAVEISRTTGVPFDDALSA